MKVRGGERSALVGRPSNKRAWGRILSHAQASTRPRRIDGPNLSGGETHERKGQIMNKGMSVGGAAEAKKKRMRL